MKHPALPIWSNPSVKRFAGPRDPIETMVERANSTVMTAIDLGWTGPPFDTFALATILGHVVIPSQLVRDARTVPLGKDKYQIEYNPEQPMSRIRFSVAHEIAHTLFPDCLDAIRNRASKEEMRVDDWQLEMLCNIGASEFLMPVSSFPDIDDKSLSIDVLLQLRERYQVSMEAILHRMAKLHRFPLGIFAASIRSDRSQTLSIDYLRTTTEWASNIQTGFSLPSESVVNDCRTIGFTRKADECWDESTGQMHVECLAIPPYPGADSPRVVGIVRPSLRQAVQRETVHVLAGDATKPVGLGNKIIAHVVNTGTPRWGGGFARVVAKTWPDVQKDFVSWVEEDRSHLVLGSIRHSRVGKELAIVSMVAQQGYGPSPRPRIRYGALEACLLEVAKVAQKSKASIHMPRVGCGQAGGSWPVVQELIDSLLCRLGISVTVYDPPDEHNRWTLAPSQPSLFGKTSDE